MFKNSTTLDEIHKISQHNSAKKYNQIMGSSKDVEHQNPERAKNPNSKILRAKIPKVQIPNSQNPEFVQILNSCPNESKSQNPKSLKTIFRIVKIPIRSKCKKPKSQTPKHRDPKF